MFQKFDNERVRSLKEILKLQYAIIDIGSNTMRLVIYEKQSGGFYKEIENTKVVARLRNYLVDGVLSEEGKKYYYKHYFNFKKVHNSISYIMYFALQRQQLDRLRIKRRLKNLLKDKQILLLEYYQNMKKHVTAI